MPDDKSHVGEPDCSRVAGKRNTKSTISQASTVSPLNKRESL